MRDLLMFVIVFGLLPIVLKHPWVGAMLWTWLSIMNPHRLAWGPAFDFPFAAVVAITTTVGLLVTRDKRHIPINAVTITLLLFMLWMGVTSAFAIYPDLIGEMLRRVMKIQFMIFVTLALLHTRKHVEIFLWIIVGCLGFYGIKGAIFTLMRSGEHRVWGPAGSFIEGNNELALALVMTIPLIKYLHGIQTNQWIRWGLVAAMILCAMATLGTYSRGAFIAIVAMAGFLWIRNSRKLVFGSALMIVGVTLLAFMPAAWTSRMYTIENYQLDASATGRLNAWQMAFNLARDRLPGGGFEVAQSEVFAYYAPDPNAIHAAHSIYFQVLGEHGFIGLALFMAFWFFTWRSAGWVRKHARRSPETQWASELAAMVQVSLVGYFVGGAFLSLAYFDLPYNMMIAILVCRGIIEARLRGSATSPVSVTRDAPATAKVGTATRKHA